MTRQSTAGPQMMYVCEICAEHASESCGYNDAGMIRLSPSGKWLCEYCYDDEEPEDFEDYGGSPLWSDLPKAPSFAFFGIDTAQPMPEYDLLGDISAELIRARRKFPGKNVTFAALVEEVGELAKATFEESADRVRKEAVQVAVMAMRMILDGDHCYEPWRAEKGLDPLDPAAREARAKEAAAKRRETLAAEAADRGEPA